MPSGAVVAAGAVVLRRGGREALVVHRPRYDDWAWPKGKQDPGEHVTVTAVREVTEETGLRIRLGRPLPRQTYSLDGGRSKCVHYWVGRVRGEDDVSRRVPDDEIDEVRWVPVQEARTLLSYDEDRRLLSDALRRPRRTTPLVVVRHAAAVSRQGWQEPDRLRPLTDGGEEQAAALAPVLAAYGVKRLISSPSRRCLQTVAPLGRPAEELPALEEGQDPSVVAALVAALLNSRRPTALCTHRPVLPTVFAGLGLEEEPLVPGELVVAHHRRGHVVATERHLPGHAA